MSQVSIESADVVEPLPVDTLASQSHLTVRIPESHHAAWRQLKVNIGATSDDEAMVVLLDSHTATRSRFMPLPEIAEALSTSHAQVYALVRSGQLPAIKVGGRGQWRVERSRFEAWIARQYEHAYDHRSPEYRADWVPAERS